MDAVFERAFVVVDGHAFILATNPATPRCVMRLPSCCGTIGHSRRGDRPMGRSIRTRGVSMNRFARRLARDLLLSCGVCAANAQVGISQVYEIGRASGRESVGEYG